MIFGSHVEFGGHFGYSLYGRKRYSHVCSMAILIYLISVKSNKEPSFHVNYI